MSFQDASTILGCIFFLYFFFTSEMDCFHINSVFLSVNPVSILFAYLGDVLMQLLRALI